MYFNINFNVFFKLIKVHLLVSEIYIHQNARCNDKKKNGAVLKCDASYKHFRERCHGNCVNPLIWFLPNYTPLQPLILTNLYCLNTEGLKSLCRDPVKVCCSC